MKKSYIIKTFFFRFFGFFLIQLFWLNKNIFWYYKYILLNRNLFWLNKGIFWCHKNMFYWIEIYFDWMKIYFDIIEIYFIEYKFILTEWKYVLISHKNYFCNILATIPNVEWTQFVKTRTQNQFPKMMMKVPYTSTHYLKSSMQKD